MPLSLALFETAKLRPARFGSPTMPPLSVQVNAWLPPVRNRATDGNSRTRHAKTLRSGVAGINDADIINLILRSSRDALA